MKIGCQTYTWEMLGDSWKGDPDELLDAIADAGYEGIEITDNMIGHYAADPAGFATALRDRNLALVAYAVASPTGFTDPGALAEDLARAEGWLRFVGSFPGAVCSLGSATAFRSGDRRDMIDVAARFYNEVGRRGKQAGVPVAFHPSSHHGSVLTTRADYDRIMDKTDPDLVMWVPDTGHIVRGGQDLRATLRDYAHRIAYVHLKDVGADGEWRMMGEGVCNMPEIVALLGAEPGFDGWLVLEEEAPEAARDPAAAVRRNRDYLAAILG